MKQLVIGLIFVLLSSCMKFEQRSAIEAIGENARVAAIINLTQIAKSVGDISHSFNAEFPEIQAIESIHGVDFDKVGVVSYSPSMSAVVFSISKPRVLKHSLGKPVASNSVRAAYRITDETFFVSDSVFLWMLDSPAGPDSALVKAERLALFANSNLAEWKVEALNVKYDESIRAIFARDRNNLELLATINKKSINFSLLCLNDAGEHTRLCPAQEWENIPIGQLGKIDPRNAFSLACGSINGKDPFNIAFPSLTPTDAARIIDIAKGIHSLKGVARLDSLSRYAPIDSTRIGTSYKDCLLATVLNLDASQTSALGIPAAIGVSERFGISAIAVVMPSAIHGRFDIIPESYPESSDSPTPSIAEFIPIIRELIH